MIKVWSVAGVLGLRQGNNRLITVGQTLSPESEKSHFSVPVSTNTSCKRCAPVGLHKLIMDQPITRLNWHVTNQKWPQTDRAVVVMISLNDSVTPVCHSRSTLRSQSSHLFQNNESARRWQIVLQHMSFLPGEPVWIWAILHKMVKFNLILSLITERYQLQTRVLWAQ